ncbi:MAG: T9SS type A sorting domain-containing protein [Arachidicoccus sp.]|nr:T9SS type A sorting domain-containing protein [Arachidicoccus sp.]
MKKKSILKFLIASFSFAAIPLSLMAQYQKMNFATSYVSGSNVSNGTNAIGFNPTNSGAFTTGPATFAGGGLFSGSADVATYTFGEESETTHDTIYLKVQSAALIGDISLTNITIQPLDGGANAGNAGHPILYSYPSVTNSGLSDGRMLMYVATAKFDGVKITYNAPAAYGPSLSLYETFFKSQGKPWPQDCDRPFESIHNISGITAANFTNPYDIMDNGSDYLSTYSAMSYVLGSIGATFTQEIYFPSPGSGSDEIRLQAGVPANLLSALLSYGGDIADNVTVQPYLNDSATKSAATLSNIISVQFGPLTTLINLISGNNIKPIYYKPGVPFNKVVIKWSIPVAIGTLNQFAFYDIRRVAETPKISTADSQAVCINTTGLQLSAGSVTGEPNLTFQWYAKNPNGSVDSTPIATGNTFTIPDSYLTTAGHKVFYVAAVRSVCGSVISDADSAIVQVYAKPVFTNSALPNGIVGTAYTTSNISTDSAATYTLSNLPPGLSFNASSNTISGTPTVAGTYTVAATATATNGAHCPITTYYDVVIKPANSLPVTITDFSGNAVNGTVSLHWDSKTEINNKGFELLRGMDGKLFSHLAYIASQAVNGNSTSPLSYKYTDVAALNGANYYQLKQIDLAGTSVTVQTISILVSGVASGLKVYPNPTSADINIQGAEAGSTYSIVSDGGNTVVPANLLTSSKISVAALPAGIYILKITGKDNKISTIKFIKK